MSYLASRSVLTLVNRVLRESGWPEVTAITSQMAKIVLDALNDGAAAIWNSNRWTFQLNNASIALVANQATYALPDGFDRLAEPFRITGTLGYCGLLEMTPEDWWGNGLGDSSQVGTPQYFKIEQLTATFYKTPSADFITQCPLLDYQYFKGNPERRATTDINSSWDLPLDFEDAHVKYARARLKQFLGDPDTPMDLRDFDQALQLQVNKWRQARKPMRLRPEDWVISSWG